LARSVNFSSVVFIVSVLCLSAGLVPVSESNGGKTWAGGG
jgi:hypothetical protein